MTSSARAWCAAPPPADGGLFSVPEQGSERLAMTARALPAASASRPTRLGLASATVSVPEDPPPLPPPGAVVGRSTCSQSTTFDHVDRVEDRDVAAEAARHLVDLAVARLDRVVAADDQARVLAVAVERVAARAADHGVVAAAAVQLVVVAGAAVELIVPARRRRACRCRCRRAGRRRRSTSRGSCRCRRRRRRRRPASPSARRGPVVVVAPAEHHRGRRGHAARPQLMSVGFSWKQPSPATMPGPDGSLYMMKLPLLSTETTLGPSSPVIVMALPTRVAVVVADAAAGRARSRQRRG